MSKALRKSLLSPRHNHRIRCGSIAVHLRAGSDSAHLQNKPNEMITPNSLSCSLDWEGSMLSAVGAWWQVAEPERQCAGREGSARLRSRHLRPGTCCSHRHPYVHLASFQQGIYACSSRAAGVRCSFSWHFMQRKHYFEAASFDAVKPQYF